MRRHAALITGFALLTLLAACSGGGNKDVAIPRPKAWPRIAVYDSVYTSVSGLPVTFDANTGAHVTLKPGTYPGADLVYPAYNATVYLTIIPELFTADDYIKAWNGRRERILRNVGGVPNQIESVENDNGYQCAIVTVSASSQTPVQVLAGNPDKGTIVSATAFLNTTVTPANYDSIRPVITALARDLTCLGQSLK